MTNTISEVPVLLLTGYLGSGKTTLLNRILANRSGIKFAVIVNDLGEVNIDAELIERGGIVGQDDESLVALQNGCICCTLKMDLLEQLHDICEMRRFDYIVIEASGICEPGPIAQTICSIPALGAEYNDGPIAVLDCIVSVVDALRMQSEFQCGDALSAGDFGEEDIESLIIQQIEFCNLILLNKASAVSPQELGRIRSIIRAIQPKAEIIECDYCDVELDKLVGTGSFDFESVATSAAWIDAIEGEHTEEEHGHSHEEHHDDEPSQEPCLHEGECGHHHEGHDHSEHDGHHHERHDHSKHDGHHHAHTHEHLHNEEEGEAEEYGISSFVYCRRAPFNLNYFDHFVAKHWPGNIIRAKGICYFSDETDKCYLFEQAGVQKSIKDAGLWYATMPSDELEAMLKQDTKLARDWDPCYGDRMIKIVFIGQKLDRQSICSELDKCLSQ